MASIEILHAGLPPWLLDWAAGRSIAVAMESGTYLGDSADRLVRLALSKVDGVSDT